MTLSELMSAPQTEEQRRFIYLNLVQPMLQSAFTSLDAYFQQIYRISPPIEQVRLLSEWSGNISQASQNRHKRFAPTASRGSPNKESGKPAGALAYTTLCQLTFTCA